MKVGEKIRKPIRIDQTTRLVSRGKFARLCVEVDITKPLLSKFKNLEEEFVESSMRGSTWFAFIVEFMAIERIIVQC